MTSEDVTESQVIAIQSTLYRLLNAVFGVPLAFIGVSCFMGATFNPLPPVGSDLYAIPWIVIPAFVILLLSRNIIVRLLFKKMSHSSFLSLVYLGRIACYAVALSEVYFFMMGSLFSSASLLVSFGLFFMFVPIFFAFSDSLAVGGEIRILFWLLSANLDDFEKRQQYLEKISKKVESQLKMGNIKVRHKEFVYYFNMKLLEGNNIRNDLRNIKAWMIDKKTSCFESLRRIYPEERFEPYMKESLSRKFAKDPIITRLLSLVFIFILLAAFPELRSQILDWFFKLPPIP